MSAVREAELKLEKAQARYDKAKAAFEAADARLASPKDPGALSGVKGQFGEKHRAKRAKDWNRGMDAWHEYQAAEAALKQAQGALRIAQRNETSAVDLDTLAPGDFIRHGAGAGTWDRVKRINAKTITCHASAPGFDEPRIPKARVLETRKINEENS